jgi:serine/threonine-protein kinase
LSPSRWRQVRELFEAALELPAEARASFVRERAGGDDVRVEEVLSLLESHAAATDFLEGSAIAPPDRTARGPGESHRTTPERVGPWRVAGVLGQGGMGDVFLGARAAGGFEQRVAIKLMRRGMVSEAMRRRFLSECQILAGLEHANIARLYDGGATEDGVPYVVMEYVEGENLFAHCDARQLTVEARLRLFVKVCDAVQFAHRHLVVHRDLKPSNILVSADGEPKLLDFGIAKILGSPAAPGEAETVTTLRWMTPEYASPEQVLGRPVTTASDVYSLGVVLYELLSGRKPYRRPLASALDLERAVVEEEAERPSTAASRDEPSPGGASAVEIASLRGVTPPRLPRLLRGDLDNILLKALEKDPERRYATAAELGDDIVRSLGRLPVRAREASSRYRAARFVRRHRVGVAAALVVVAAISGLSAFYALRLREQRDLARRESARAGEVTSFLARLLAGADPNKTRGATLTLRQFLSEAPQRVESGIADPRVRADVLHVVGEAQWHAGAQREAIEPLSEALALRERELGAAHPDTGRTLTVLGAAKGQIGETREGQELLKRGIAILEAALGEDSADLVWPLDRLGILYLDENTVQAESLVRRALRIHYLRGTPLADRAYLFQHLALFARSLGDNRRGAELYLRSYEVSAATLSPESPLAANALCNAARAFNEIGESRRALALQQQAQGALERAWKGDNVQLAGCLRAGAETLVQLDRLDEARALAEQAHAMDRRLYGDDHMQTVNMLATIAYVADAQGRIEESARLWGRFLDFQKAEGGFENHGWVPAYLAQARWALSRGDRAAAEKLARHALALQENELAAGEAMFVPTLVFLGELARARGDDGEARALLEQAAAIARAKLTPEQRDYRVAISALGALDGRIRPATGRGAPATAASGSSSRARPQTSNVTPWASGSVSP